MYPFNNIEATPNSKPKTANSGNPNEIAQYEPSHWDLHYCHTVSDFCQIFFCQMMVLSILDGPFQIHVLTHKAPIMTAADPFINIFSLFFIENKT